METIKQSQSLNHHPGGFEITDIALELCSFLPGPKILDVGCGSGVTVDYIRHHYGFETYGIDKNLEISEKKYLKKAPGELIPFQSAFFDGIISECSFSLMDDQIMVLKECHRVLKTDGYLIISDLYAHGEPANLSGCLGRIEKKETIISKIENQGFQIRAFRDFTHSLQTMWGQMIFGKGANEFYCSLGTSPETMKGIKCGYFLIVAQKTG